jgi:hypothetical protein
METFMKNNFLVLLCGHVDSEKKKNLVLETLDGLKKECIDVCYSTHTSNYIDEISKKVNFVIFDNNNDFVTGSDFIENVDLILDTEKYRASVNIKYESFGTIYDFRPLSPHSRSALSLLKNGTMFSHSKLYEWSVYLEYDIPTPKYGYRELIESKISLLENKNGDCFYYKNDSNGYQFLWGGLFIFRTEHLYNNHKFMNYDWYSSSRNWISNWNIGFFELICEDILIESFNNSKILTESIINDSLERWSKVDYHQIQKHYFDENYQIIEKISQKGLVLGLYPSKKDNQYNINLYINYTMTEQLLISNIVVKNETQILFQIDELYPTPGFWYLWPVEYNNCKKIVLEYTLSNKVYTKNFSITYNLEYKDIMYNNLCRIEFN